MLKVKEDVTRERDSLLKEVATLRDQMESVSAAQQRADDEIEQAEIKISEVCRVRSSSLCLAFPAIR